MPESYGKRQREAVKAKKATEREERRVARNQRRDAREAGIEEPGAPLGDPVNGEGPSDPEDLIQGPGPAV